QHIHFPVVRSVPLRTTTAPWDGELNIHQPDNLQRPRQAERIVAHASQQVLGNLDRRQDARGIAGVDSRFFNVLHDPADDDIFAVGERVYIDFNRVFEKVIDQHGAIVGIFNCFSHVVNDRLFVVGNHHGAPAQNVGGTNQHGVADALGALHRLFDGGGDGAGRLRDVQFFQQFSEAFAVFREVDRF